MGKAPNPHGSSMEDCSDIVKANLMKVLNKFFEAGTICKRNQLHLPRLDPKEMKQRTQVFKPLVGFQCGCTITTEVLASRLKEVVINIVGQCRCTFEKDKHIHDSILLANECVEKCSLSNKQGVT